MPKFSKFIYSYATIFPSRINLLLFWFPQVDADIRKPSMYKFGIERPGQSTDASTGLEDDTDDEFGNEDEQTMYGDEEQDDENVQRLRAARDGLEQHEQERRIEHQNGGDGNVLDEGERIAHKPIGSIDDDYPLYDSEHEEEECYGLSPDTWWEKDWSASNSMNARLPRKLTRAMLTTLTL